MQNNTMTIIDAFRRHGCPLTVGVITGFGDCYATDLRDRLAGIELSSHSVTHRAMPSLSFAAQYEELANSRAKLFQLFGVNVSLFIPPRTFHALFSSEWLEQKMRGTWTRFGHCRKTDIG